ncbi:MAG: hypothetical protein Q8O99_07255 [bacterium]|nr:hypothetical protein [bacterium]
MLINQTGTDFLFATLTQKPLKIKTSCLTELQQRATITLPTISRSYQ